MHFAALQISTASPLPPPFPPPSLFKCPCSLTRSQDANILRLWSLRRFTHQLQAPFRPRPLPLSSFSFVFMQSNALAGCKHTPAVLFAALHASTASPLPFPSPSSSLLFRLCSCSLTRSQDANILRLCSLRRCTHQLQANFKPPPSPVQSLFPSFLFVFMQSNALAGCEHAPAVLFAALQISTASPLPPPSPSSSLLFRLCSCSLTRSQDANILRLCSLRRCKSQLQALCRPRPLRLPFFFVCVHAVYRARRMQTTVSLTPLSLARHCLSHHSLSHVY